MVGVIRVPYDFRAACVIVIGIGITNVGIFNGQILVPTEHLAIKGYYSSGALYLFSSF
jgi:hypothetical protein